MIAVVTGSSGFIGQNLVRRLRRDGHEVRCLVRPSGATGPVTEGGDAGPGGAARGTRRHVVRYDDPDSLLRCEALDQADVVFHLAGVTKAARPAEFTEANVTPTRHLLGAIRARRLHPRFVLVSSQATGGPAPSRYRAVDENDVPRPIEAYGRSKLEAERIAESFSDHVAITIVRPCAVFGPRDRDFLPLFRLAKRGIMVYPGVAAHWLSILFVEDLLDGLLAAATLPAAIARTYFLASESPVQWRTLGGLVADAAGRSARHIDLPASLVRIAALAGETFGRMTGVATLANRSKAALSVPPYWICSASRARQELAFAPSHSLPDAIRETYYWYRHHGWLGGARRARGGAD